MPTLNGSTPTLHDLARHVVVPEGIVSTSWGAVRNKCAELGINFEPWQEGAGKLFFAKRADGKFAASRGGCCASLPRQVGKSFLIGSIVFAVCLLEKNVKAIWTAHRTTTADETFDSMVEMSKLPNIAPFVRTIRRANGEQRIVFTNGSRIEFGAREMGFGRGKTKVKLLVLDEGQIMSEAAMENLVPTMNRATDPLMFIIGTPPRPIDNAEMFKNKRRRALSGQSKDALYIEFSADRGADIEDRAQWAIANPSYPTFTDEDAMIRMMESFGAASFRREALGIWDSDDASSRRISAEDWERIGVTDPPQGRQGYAVAYSYDGSRVALAGVRRLPDGSCHVQLIDAMSGDVKAGTSGLADWLAERWRSSLGIWISGAAGAALEQELHARKVGRRKVDLVSTGRYLGACAAFDSAVSDSVLAVSQGGAPLVTHWLSEGQLALDDSVAVCDQAMRGKTGAFGWRSTVPGGDETPLEAVSLAYSLGRSAKASSSSGGGGSSFA